MKGKSTFTKEEADEIVRLIRQKLKASPSDQKHIRDQIRKLGFYARDFGIGGGYNEQDFRNVVKIEGEAGKKAVIDLTDPRFGITWLHEFSADTWDTLFAFMGKAFETYELPPKSYTLNPLSPKLSWRFSLNVGPNLVFGVGAGERPVIRLFHTLDGPADELAGIDLLKREQLSNTNNELLHFSFEQFTQHTAQLSGVWLRSLSSLVEMGHKTPYSRSHWPVMVEASRREEVRRAFIDFVTAPLQERIIQVYMALIVKDNNDDERYKWKLIKSFHDSLNDPSDYLEMLNVIDFANLIDSRSLALMELGKEHPKDGIALIESLLDESLPLHDRIKMAKEKGQEMIDRWKPKYANAFDERTVSWWLAFVYPEKYPGYKYTYYADFIDRKGIAKARAGERYEHYLQLLESFIDSYVRNNAALLEQHKSTLDKDCIDDLSHLLLAQNIWYRVLDQCWGDLSRIDDDEFDEEMDDATLENLASPDLKHHDMKPELNQILFGPPGTGKTYNTIDMAVEIIDGKKKSHAENKVRFDELVEQGQIVFSTFHQSFTYEDFIEGIKPVMGDDRLESEGSELLYEISDGIFKRLVNEVVERNSISSESAQQVSLPESYFHRHVVKLSLGNSQLKEDDVIYDYCTSNDCVAIGFGGGIDFSGVSSIKDIRSRFKEAGVALNGPSDFNVAALQRFIFWAKQGDLVLVPKGTTQIRAIAEVTGDYFYDPDAPIGYSHFRRVKWLYKDIDIPIKQVYPSRFSHQTIYVMDGKSFDYSFFSKTAKSKKQKANHVLVIDEINRGNVSQIFGEIITLLEGDKREGEPNALSIQLPYSKERFMVPPNLYVLGTMNTADRSVEALDTALRRRFSFVEMPPKYDLEELNRRINGVHLAELLKTINQRIEKLLDKDHMIGHAYFMGVRDMEGLRRVFQDKIVPLLQEYFFGDFGKIGLVLGPSFIEVDKESFIGFAEFEYTDSSSQEDFERRIVFRIAPSDQWNLSSIISNNSAI